MNDFEKTRGNCISFLKNLIDRVKNCKEHELLSHGFDTLEIEEFSYLDYKRVQTRFFIEFENKIYLDNES
jgi:hypothetical protein